MIVIKERGNGCLYSFGVDGIMDGMRIPFALGWIAAGWTDMTYYFSFLLRY